MRPVGILAHSTEGAALCFLDRLLRAGCDFFICPDNTVHQALELPGPPLPLPGLHIAEVVATRAAERGFSRVGILGTRYLAESQVYPKALGRRGIESAVPDRAGRETVDRIIFGELVHGVVTAESAQALRAVIDQLVDARCDAVALVCTELPLIVTADLSPLPLLDSPRLLAAAALDTAIDGELPTWRGGPVDR